MGASRTRRTLLGLAAASVAAIAAAALPTVSPVAATSAVVPPTCTLPTTPVSDPAPVEHSRISTPTGTFVLSGRSGGWSYQAAGCRADGAPVALTSYVVLKAPKSARWLAYVDSVSYGGRAVIVDLALPATERQFDRLRKRSRARTVARLPKVKGTVYLTSAQAPAFTTFAKRIDGKSPTQAERTAAANAVLDAGDPFADGTPLN